MFIYSSFDDRLFKVNLRIWNILQSKENIKKLIESVIGYEVYDIHIGAEFRSRDALAIEIWVNTKHYVSSVILIETSRPLDTITLQAIVDSIDEEYKRLWGIMLDLGRLRLGTLEFLEDLRERAEELNEDIEYLTSTNIWALRKVLRKKNPKPWQVILVVCVKNSCSIYIVPRQLAKMLIEELRDLILTKSLSILPAPQVRNSKSQ
ncbi:MAG: hypothetical protein DRO15_00245 [Thermoprotei archaeon]|nr:MAG: hypothetical protein DRO15_00245 [Thermoprotei archaeon]